MHHKEVGIQMLFLFFAATALYKPVIPADNHNYHTKNQIKIKENRPAAFPAQSKVLSSGIHF